MYVHTYIQAPSGPLGREDRHDVDVRTQGAEQSNGGGIDRGLRGVRRGWDTPRLFLFLAPGADFVVKMLGYGVKKLGQYVYWVLPFQGTVVCQCVANVLLMCC